MNNLACDVRFQCVYNLNITDYLKCYRKHYFGSVNLVMLVITLLSSGSLLYLEAPN